MKTTSPDRDSNLAATPALEIAGKKIRSRKPWLLAILLIPILAVAYVKWDGKKPSAQVEYKTLPVQQGDLTVTVTATGNLQPTNQIIMGSELSGIIKTVEVDYNDQVKTGQVLARLDTSKLEAQVLQAKAALESARAKVVQAQATIQETRAALARLQEVRILSNSKAVSLHDMDTAKAALERAMADETSAKATVNQAQAALNAMETDLAKTVIRSPINGVVLVRSVEPGQTVAASLQAPVLFTLAEDLTQMELHVDVDEADVAQVKTGQEAAFSVDAYPNRKFPAQITQVRFGPKTLNGVVTYETLLNVNNSDLSLRPGMTATADIIVRKIEKALLVPNAALRFSPPEKSRNDRSQGGGLLGAIFRRPGGIPEKPKDEGPAGKKQHQVWTLQNGRLHPISISIGSSDGSRTEVIQGDLQADLPLVVDTVSAKP